MGRFRDSQTGRFVAWADVRRVLDRTLAELETGMVRDAARLQQGTISLAEWQRGMEASIKRVHLISYAMERGGWQHLAPSDYGRIGRILYNPSGTLETGTAGEYQYLRRLAGQIASGAQPMDGNLVRRVRLYARQGRATYHRAERELALLMGFDEARSLLGIADHCRECIAEDAAGWRPARDVVPIGSRICKANCKCMIAYRNARTGDIFNPPDEA